MDAVSSFSHKSREWNHEERKEALHAWQLEFEKITDNPVSTQLQVQDPPDLDLCQGVPHPPPQAVK